MSATHVWKASRNPAAEKRPLLVTKCGSVGRPRTVVRRLRALLTAQALINGATGTPDDVAFVEDDHSRMAGRLAT